MDYMSYLMAHGIAAGMVAFSTLVLLQPLDVCRARMAIHRDWHPSVTQCVSATGAHLGVPGLYRGLGMGVWIAVVSDVVSVLLYDSLVGLQEPASQGGKETPGKGGRIPRTHQWHRWREGIHLTVLPVVLAGGICFPMQTLRARLMAGGSLPIEALRANTFTGTDGYQLARHMVGEAGSTWLALQELYRGLFLGLVWLVGAAIAGKLARMIASRWGRAGGPAHAAVALAVCLAAALAGAGWPM